jgi:hypothetical protein
MAGTLGTAGFSMTKRAFGDDACRHIAQKATEEDGRHLGWRHFFLLTHNGYAMEAMAQMINQYKPWMIFGVIFQFSQEITRGSSPRGESQDVRHDLGKSYWDVSQIRHENMGINKKYNSWDIICSRKMGMLT